MTTSTDEAHRFIDATNRFVPYIVHNDNGPFTEVPIENYENAIWYTDPVQHKTSILTEPYDYEVSGNTLSMLTLSIPV